MDIPILRKGGKIKKYSGKSKKIKERRKRKKITSIRSSLEWLFVSLVVVF